MASLTHDSSHRNTDLDPQRGLQNPETVAKVAIRLGCKEIFWDHCKLGVGQLSKTEKAVMMLKEK